MICKFISLAIFSNIIQIYQFVDVNSNSISNNNNDIISDLNSDSKGIQSISTLNSNENSDQKNLNLKSLQNLAPNVYLASTILPFKSSKLNVNGVSVGKNDILQIYEKKPYGPEFPLNNQNSNLNSNIISGAIEQNQKSNSYDSISSIQNISDNNKSEGTTISTNLINGKGDTIISHSQSKLGHSNKDTKPNKTI